MGSLASKQKQSYCISLNLIKTQRKMRLTENQSSSEGTKRKKHLGKKMAHIFPMETAKEISKRERYRAQII